jgi:hypothetical protein
MEPSPTLASNYSGGLWFQSSQEKNFRQMGTFSGFRFPRMNIARKAKRPGKPGRSQVS